MATYQFVHEIWVRAGGQQLSAGQGLVNKRVVLKGVPKGRLHPAHAGLHYKTHRHTNRALNPRSGKCYIVLHIPFYHNSKKLIISNSHSSKSDRIHLTDDFMQYSSERSQHCSVFGPHYLRHRQAQRRAPAGEPLGLLSGPSGGSVMFPNQLNKLPLKEWDAEYRGMHPVRLEDRGLGSVTRLTQLWSGLLWIRSVVRAENVRIKARKHQMKYLKTCFLFLERGQTKGPFPQHPIELATPLAKHLYNLLVYKDFTGSLCSRLQTQPHCMFGKYHFHQSEKPRLHRGSD